MALENPNQLPIQAIYPAYVYREYADDDDVVAMFANYNQECAQYLLWANQVAIADWTNPAISGPFLDWVGSQLYALPRPYVYAALVYPPATTNAHPYANKYYDGQQYGSGSTSHGGNTSDELPASDSAYTEIGYTGFYYTGTVDESARSSAPQVAYMPISDDLYRAYLTWKLYRGDGTTPSLNVIRQRIARFLSMNPFLSPPSLKFTSDRVLLVTAPVSNAFNAFQALYNQGILTVPMQYTLTFAE